MRKSRLLFVKGKLKNWEVTKRLFEFFKLNFFGLGYSFILVVPLLMLWIISNSTNTRPNADLFSFFYFFLPLLYLFVYNRLSFHVNRKRFHFGLIICVERFTAIVMIVLNPLMSTQFASFLLMLIDLVVIMLIAFYCRLHYIILNGISSFKHDFLKIILLSSLFWILTPLFQIVIAYLLNFFHIYLPNNSKNEDLIRKEIASSTALQITLLFISIVILAPLLEEIIFRQSLFSIFDSKKLAIFVSVLIFSAVHVIYMGDIVSIFAYIPMSLSLSLLFYFSGQKLSYSIFFHFVNNLIAFSSVLVGSLS